MKDDDHTQSEHEALKKRIHRIKRLLDILIKEVSELEQQTLEASNKKFLFSVKEVSKITGLSRTTIDKYIKIGALKPSKIVKMKHYNKYYFTSEEILKIKEN